eukprot:2748150-Rhodomonas_salina.2
MQHVLDGLTAVGEQDERLSRRALFCTASEVMSLRRQQGVIQVSSSISSLRLTLRFPALTWRGWSQDSAVHGGSVDVSRSDTRSKGEEEWKVLADSPAARSHPLVSCPLSLTARSDSDLASDGAPRSAASAASAELSLATTKDASPHSWRDFASPLLPVSLRRGVLTVRRE